MALAGFSRNEERKERFGGSRGVNLSTFLTLTAAIILAIPILVVFGFIFVPTGDIWSHLMSTVLPVYLLNTLVLAFGVGLLVLAIGVGSAWLVTMCEFPGRKIFTWG
ncbi:MAG: hypothetical protein COB93_11720 [Sneathiella sp.]|nr:MAG: hypothetical protein COB93_11720 [Sneathiella sp.]